MCYSEELERQKIVAKWGSLIEMGVERVVVISEEGAHFMMRSGLDGKNLDFSCISVFN